MVRLSWDEKMSVENIDLLYKAIKEHHEERKLEEYQLDESKLNPTLRAYQVDAVKWMLHRETAERPETRICQGNVIEYPLGGILADEMGLGKTVEVLACILSNRCPEDIDNMINILPQPVLGKRKTINNNFTVGKKKRCKVQKQEDNKNQKKSGFMSEKYTALRMWYETILSGQTNYSTPEEVSLQCFCTTTPESETIECLECGTEQHTVCVGVTADFENYICPKCWSKKEPIKSRATFIVSPSSICYQWITEIKKHVGDPDFKVCVYEGIKGRNYIQPVDLADNDIVLTTYQVLCKELDYSLEENTQRKLRHAKRYHAPVTPLTCISWWRLCLDEAQMVEGSTSKTAMMVRCLNAKYRWAITGTPIQKSLQDLFGLVQFLRIQPYDNLSNWNSLVEEEHEFHGFICPVMWRNSKKDVFHMLQIPPQTTVMHMIHFSPVEGYFYQSMHNECSQAFSAKLSKFPDRNTPIKALDRQLVNRTLLPMLKLRQACIHPQVISGKYGKFKHTMTMEELMNEMVTKAKLDVDTALRSLVSSLNGLAAIYQIEQDFGGAVTIYRRVLSTAEEYKHVSKVDTLQMIHTLHNLSDLLEEHGAGTHESLRQQKNELEETYLKKSEQCLINTRMTVTKMTASIESQCDGRTLGFTDWWEKVINWADSDELLTKINTHLDDGILSGKSCLSNKLKNMPAVHREVAIWLANADTARVDCIAALKALNEVPKEYLSGMALSCHLGQKAPNKKNTKLCQICEVDKMLKKYESCIFSVKKQKANYLGDEEELKSAGMTNKNILELQNVQIFETKKEGNWKPTQHERVLHVLQGYTKLKKGPTPWIEDSIKHLAILEAVRKEFKWLRAEWRHLSNSVSARDELAMAKLRLRLPTPEELKENKSLKKKSDSIYVIHAHEVPIENANLKMTSIMSEAKLKRNCGILLYLKNLQNNVSNAVDVCPVCQDHIQEKWSVLQCGHWLCFECIPTMLKMSHNRHVECPVCRLKSEKAEIAFVAGRNKTHPEGEVKIEGSYSSKVRSVIIELMNLIEADPTVKVLIFSSWDKVLDVIGEALQENSISFRRLGTSAKLKNSLTQFKTGPVSALLLLLSSGSKGLNIIEATHVFLVEPILNPADELQAVGRVHRIGQTKPTFIHRFIIHNTIEERMLSSVDSNTWADGNVTLNELFGLFHLRDEHTNETNTIDAQNE